VGLAGISVSCGGGVEAGEGSWYVAQPAIIVATRKVVNIIFGNIFVFIYLRRRNLPFCSPPFA
jgi:hypothetical protein